MERRNDAPDRSVTDIGTGDYVKIGRHWKEVAHNSAHGAEHAPRDWTVRTTDGASYGMYGINRYAKAVDMEA